MVKKISLLVMACIMSLMLIKPIESMAAEHDYFVNFAEPTTSDKQGYITLLLYNPNTNKYALNTWFWSGSLTSVQNNQSVDFYYGMQINISGSTISFNVFQANGINYPNCQIFSINNNGYYRHRASILSQSPFTYTYSNDIIVGMKYKGNIYSCYIDKEEVPFSMNFNQDGSAILLQNQFNVLLDMYSQDTQMLNKIIDIMNTSNSIDSKMSQLIELQRNTNTWLEKIFNLLENAPEEEKNQASTQGGNSVSEGTNAIEDKGQGFSDSLGGLVNSMSYEGTDCSWTFPTVKLPAISGVMSETTLIQSQEINFGMWIDAIPDDIMLLIRSVLTMGLIVYCFKEFYDTIAYLLTLRRSDNE